MLIERLIRRGRRASVAVEFALVSVFLLLPLLAGGSDFVVLLSAQAQLNTALQALDYFGWTNPSAATNTADIQSIISAIDQGSVYNIPTANLSATTSFGCFSSSANPVVITDQTTPCTGTQTQQTLVTYKVTASIFLPLPLPGLKSPFRLSATGTIQIQ
jgi:Flp pilus assembly protein TadG